MAYGEPDLSANEADCEAESEAAEEPSDSELRAFVAAQHSNPIDEESSPCWPTALSQSNGSPGDPIQHAFHTSTQVLVEVSLVVDTAAWGNLQGDVWTRNQAAAAKAAGLVVPLPAAPCPRSWQWLSNLRI